MSKQQAIESRRCASPAGTVSARMAGGERRLQIVLVAMRLFSQKGFRGTTTKQIAVAAGVSEAIIFRHFATKKELYAAILDHKACAVNATQLHEVVAGAVAAGDDQAVFSGLADAMLRHHEEDAEFLRLLLFSALEGHELHQMFWDRNVRQLAEFLRAYTRERQRCGAFRRIDPAIVVRAFTGMVIHHSLVNTLFDRSRSLLNIDHETAAREFTDILLHGVAVTETPHPEGRKRAGNSKSAANAKKK
ncbi:MAG: TetR/AcrR family transcriptional regulator [Pyrinomonadaceae bacterium]